MNGQTEGTEQGALINLAASTLTERLQAQRNQTAERLAQLDEALAALKSNPEVARTVDAISKLGNLY